MAQPTFRLAVRNRSPYRLYAALVTLSDDWEIRADLFPAGGAWIEAGLTGLGAGWSAGLRLGPQGGFWDRGVPMSATVSMAIVSDREFDARLLEQPKLGLPRQDRAAGGRHRQ